MDSLYSPLAWHAPLLKTDHCALFGLRFSICAFVLRNVCTPNLALSLRWGGLSLNLSMFPTNHRGPVLTLTAAESLCQKELTIFVD